MYRTARDPAAPLVVLGTNGAVVGIDLETGAEAWRNALDGAAFGAIDVIVHHELVIASGLAATVFAIDYHSGRTLWKAATSGLHGRTTLAVVGDRVLVTRGGAIDCLSLSGERLWTRTSDGAGEITIGSPRSRG